MYPFCYFENKIQKKIVSVFVKKMKKKKKRKRALRFTKLYLMEVQVISKPKIKVLGSYDLQFTVKQTVLDG